MGWIGSGFESLGLTLSGIARPTPPVATPATDQPPSLQLAGEGAIVRSGGVDGISRMEGIREVKSAIARGGNEGFDW